jgi:hypothetical protein
MRMLCLNEARQRPLSDVYAIALPPILLEEQDERLTLEAGGIKLCRNLERGSQITD